MTPGPRFPQYRVNKTKQHTHTLAVHEGAIPYFVVLPDSELSITEITEYSHFNPLKPCCEFIHKSE